MEELLLIDFYWCKSGNHVMLQWIGKSSLSSFILDVLSYLGKWGICIIANAPESRTALDGAYIKSTSLPTTTNTSTRKKLGSWWHLVLNEIFSQFSNCEGSLIAEVDSSGPNIKRWQLLNLKAIFHLFDSFLIHE